MSETEHTGTGTGTGRTGCICAPVPVCCVCLCACTCRSLQPTALSPERRACSVPPSCRHAGSHVGSCRPVARVIATPCVASGDKHDVSCVTCVDVVAHHAPCLHLHPCCAPPTCSSTSSGSSGASGSRLARLERVSQLNGGEEESIYIYICVCMCVYVCVTLIPNGPRIRRLVCAPSSSPPLPPLPALPPLPPAAPTALPTEEARGRPSRSVTVASSTDAPPSAYPHPWCWCWCWSLSGMSTTGDVANVSSTSDPCSCPRPSLKRCAPLGLSNHEGAGAVVAP